MEKCLAAQDAVISASGWKPQTADAGPPIKHEQLRSQGQGD